MKSLTLLLIPLLFLSSCTIDWDNNISRLSQENQNLNTLVQTKDQKIKELEKNIDTTAATSGFTVSLTGTNNPDYKNILISQYEGGQSYLMDTTSDTILFEIPSGEAQKVTRKNNILTVLVAGNYAANMIYTYDIEKKKVTEKKVIQDDAEYLKLLNK